MRSFQRAVLVMVLTCGTTAASAGSYTGGDAVWFEWRPNAWRRATVDGSCVAGVRVKDFKGRITCRSRHLLAPDQPIEPAAVAPGQRVLAPWSNRRLYAGRIAAVLPDGRVRVEFDDGDAGFAPISALRPLHSPGAGPNLAPTGTRVWVQRRPNQWTRATVRGSCPGGAKVVFSGGNRARCLGFGLIAQGQVPQPGTAGVGTRVLALWRDARLYPATIVAANQRGSYQVRFDDGALDSAGGDDIRRIGP